MDKDHCELDVVQYIADVIVREGALRSGCELDSSILLTIHEFAEAVAKGRHAGRWGLEVEVEAIDHGVSEGAVLGFWGAGAEGLPDGVCAVDGV